MVKRWILLLLLIQFLNSSFAFAPITNYGRRLKSVLRYSSSPCFASIHPHHTVNVGYDSKLSHISMVDSSSSFEDSSSSSSSSSLDPLLIQAALTLRRTSWLSWWSQVILTSVSSVTLLFAKGVLDTRPIISQRGAFIFAGTGIGLSIISILWTWGGGARLSRRILVRRRISKSNTNTPKGEETNPLHDSLIHVAQSLRKVIRVGTYINLFGMLVTLIGAEQIVGLLAARVLTTASTIGVVSSTAQVLQPLDILIVQANTNTLLSHFISLVCTLYLTYSVHSLDPPSTEED